VRSLALVLAVALLGCKDEPKSGKRRSAKPAAVEEEAKPEAQPVKDESSWIAGTWHKKGQREWLLFNPPDQVAVLGGKPVSMKSRGKFSLKGRYLTLLLPQPNGVVAERYLDVSPDRSRLTDETAAAWYERGAPPP
jgi:hypothetical protein